MSARETAIASTKACTSTPFERITTGGAKGVIVSPACGDQERWTPDRRAVFAFESGIVARLRKEPPREKPDLYRLLDGYQRQYVGEIVGGRRWLRVYFFCEEPEGFDSGEVIIEDGGSCYFNVGFDVERGEYGFVSVNGEA